MMMEKGLIEFCRELKAATEDMKWGDNLVFSVGGKMFAVFDMPAGLPLSLKVQPLVFEGLTTHDDVVPAPYLARYHWVSITREGAVPYATLEDLVRESYDLTAAKLPKRLRAELGMTLHTESPSAKS